MVVVPIPVPRGAACTASASVMKAGRCEACGCNYVYLLQCIARGEGSSFLYGLSDAATEAARAKAAQQAEAELQRQLATRTRAVACPACGRLPKSQIVTGRILRLFVFLAPAIALGGFVLAGKVSEEMTPIVWLIAGALVVLGACMALLYPRPAVPAPEPRDVVGLASALSRGCAVPVSVFDAITSAKAGAALSQTE